MTGFYGEGSAFTVFVSKREDTRFLTMIVAGSANRNQLGGVSMPLGDLSIILKNLKQMLDESAKTQDEISYSRRENKFIASINGGVTPQLGLTVDGVLVGTAGLSGEDNRRILRDVVELLTKAEDLMKQ